MLKKIPIIILLLTLSLVACTDTNLQNNNNINQSNKEKNYTIFPGEYNTSFILDNVERYTPSDEDVQKGMKIIKSYLSGNKEIRNLNEYKIQFFGYINEKDEKILFANFFCDDFGKNWEKEMIIVKDGGNCYFKITVNLDKKEAFDLNINGEA
jgi:hypothetical protein